MFTCHEVNGKIVAELTDNGLIINKVQDAIDLLGELGSEGCSSMIIYEKNLSRDFFDLKTRLAGEILKKFFLLIGVIIFPGGAESKVPAPEKPRTIITTDGEVDDMDSFIRMLLYANEFNIESLVYSS